MDDACNMQSDRYQEQFQCLMRFLNSLDAPK